MKQLSVEGTNDSISGAQKLDVVTELKQLNSQLNNIADSSTYNGINLLNTATQTLNFQVGSSTATADSFSVVTLNVTTTNGGNGMSDVGTDIIGTGATNLGTLTAGTANATWQTAFTALSGHLDTAIEGLSSSRATLGSQMNSLSYVNSNLAGQSANLSASRSTVIDTDFASETAHLTKGQIMQQAATAMLAQANQMPNVILSLLK